MARAFPEVLRSRVSEPGFYLMDPDAPLSFTACLGLVALLHDLARAGSQAVVAAHSPIVAAVPGATILELGDWKIRATQWDRLDLVSHWRRFLDDPGSYFPAPAGLPLATGIRSPARCSAKSAHG